MWLITVKDKIVNLNKFKSIDLEETATGYGISANNSMTDITPFVHFVNEAEAIECYSFIQSALGEPCRRTINLPAYLKNKEEEKNAKV